MFGSSGTKANWQPGVVYLLILVLVEITIMGVMRNFTKHGG